MKKQPKQRINLTRTIVLVLVVLGSIRSYGQQQNARQPIQLLQNGNMEKNPAKTWRLGFYRNDTSNPNGYTYNQSFDAATSGEFSLRINCNIVKNDTAHCFVYQNFPTTPIPIGAKLVLKAKIKTVNVDGKGVALGLRGDKSVNGQGAMTFLVTTEGKIPIKGTNEFEEYTLNIDSYPGNSDVIAVMLFYLPGTTGTVYVDDVSLVAN